MTVVQWSEHGCFYVRGSEFNFRIVKRDFIFLKSAIRHLVQADQTSHQTGQSIFVIITEKLSGTPLPT